jgi:hypothetical protein
VGEAVSVVVVFSAEIVAVTVVEVEAARLELPELPEYEAVSEAVPTGSEDTARLPVPLDSVTTPRATVPL